jgi:predicted TIM-barrel fold metal-dependent hydrolase
MHPPERTREERTPIVDCDVHNALAADDALTPYMPAAWRDRRESLTYLPTAFRQVRENLGDRSYMGAEYPRPTPRASRVDAWPPDGAPPASDLEFTQRQLLDAFDVEYAVLNPLLGIGEMLNLELARVMASAANDWLAAEWLDRDPRLRASIVIPYEDGAASAAEIDRVAGDPRFVQVLVLSRTIEPLGRRRYWPIFEACERHGLPLGIHNGGWGGHPITAAGYPSYYIEDAAAMACAFQDQLASLVCDGALSRWPTLRVVMIEGGFAWLPSFSRRLDLAWRKLRAEVPSVDRTPSELIRERVWFSTQPMEEPEREGQLEQLLEEMAMPDRIMFATDYPHWDFDAPDMALPRRLPAAARRRILHDNAAALYRLDVPSRAAAAGG